MNRVLLSFVFLLTTGCIADVGPDQPFLVDRITPPQRLNARSPWYSLDGRQLQLHVNYCGWDTQQDRRIIHRSIGEKVMQMVEEADELILASFFLFDNLYADEPDGDYATALAERLIARKTARPSLKVALILDNMHRGWGYRRSEIIERLRAAGVDVFYSDILDTRPALRVGVWEAMSEAGRDADHAAGGLLAGPSDAVGRIPILVPGVKLDGEQLTLSAIGNGALLKANHRKALVTKRRGDYEALTTSWNPHNPSLLHENHAVSVTGPLACYLYMVLREDIRRSIELGGRHVDWSHASSQDQQDYLKDELPGLSPTALCPAEDEFSSGGDEQYAPPEAAIATEEAIEPILMDWLKSVEAGDRVRIQMFYLARVPVVHAILDAAARTEHPIQILLDPNRVSINYARDGTPNAQVADYLLKRARKENARIEIRWYATRGEQNHAKAMSITNEQTGKYQLTLGSTNWTRKNLAGINLENNIFVRNSVELNRQFNEVFDRQWSNADPGIEYSVAWDDPRFNYHRHNGRDRWAVQRKWMFIIPRYDAKGRPQLLEQELVHW